jgi:hypothetical protein
MKTTLLLATIFLVSCSAKTIPVVVELKCPTPLVLEQLPTNLRLEADAMSKELSDYFVTRDKIQTARRETLQNICRSTHERK